MNDRMERWALGALWAFTAGAVAGFVTFGAHPELMRGSVSAQRVYASAFTVFARGQVLLAAAALILVLVRRAGAAWIGAFAAIYAASLSSELAGTTVGLPFGPYAYTAGLGPMWFGHVPLLIPLSWFMMAVPSYAIARALVGRKRGALATIACGSFVLLSWDLALDPAMSFATKYWVWGASGSYYGMPWLNLFGWYATGVVLMTILAMLRADRWIARLPLRWCVGFFLANLCLALGLCLGAGLYGALAVSVLPGLLCARALVADRGSRLAGRNDGLTIATADVA